MSIYFKPEHLSVFWRYLTSTLAVNPIRYLSFYLNCIYT